MDQANAISRYLTNFDSARIGHVLTDVLVVGGGVAGLSAALAASEGCNVLLLTKGSMADSATYWAQGGIAAVLDPTDSIEQHIEDTMTVGAGMNHTDIVELVCREGVSRIRDLIEQQMAFDRKDGKLALGLEGGHRAPRVLHTGGDATGKALSEHLTQQAKDKGNIRIFDHCFLIDLLTVDGECLGAVTSHRKYGHQLIWAARTILASGGYGRIFRETTNPPEITGDGIAAALRAGAQIADMEFVQFHPTTLYVAGATRALISEAVRGEGAYIVESDGNRFMPSYHPDAELAPRDVVSRAIVDRLHTTRRPNVFLDVRHIERDKFKKRFPTITSTCEQFGIDVATDLIPIRPAAHYSIGGVVADIQARTSLPGLLACGEASCSGLHGANRLASNSLLEGLVMGKIAGESALDDLRNGNGVRPARIQNENPTSPKTMLDLADIKQSLRALMWRNVGIIRNGDRLAETVEIIDFWSKFILDKTFDSPTGWEVQNMLLLAHTVGAAANTRNESRGVHFRDDAKTTENKKPPHHKTCKVIEGQCKQNESELNFKGWR
ncbi:MAG: L-aspartate oxidase [Planctomycetes bacterium]|nr:L-aspartate oxidase [Planctomycetota bacterium]